jgi:hypothetical protein
LGLRLAFRSPQRIHRRAGVEILPEESDPQISQLTQIF